MKRMLLTLIMFATVLSLPCSLSARNNKIDNTPVPAIDIPRYMGLWYEIARFDHRFERDMSGTIAVYSQKNNGTIRVENSGWKDNKYKRSVGKAKAVRNTANEPTLLRVSFFGPFYSDYRVLMLDENYRYALVGSGSSKYLWILSRTPDLPYHTRMNIIREAQRRGYDTSHLVWVDQNDNIRMYSRF